MSARYMMLVILHLPFSGQLVLFLQLQPVNKHSNHPPNVLKQLPKSIEKRISENSSNIEVFNQSITLYKDALRESNFSDNLQYKTPTIKNIDEENQKR